MHPFAVAKCFYWVDLLVDDKDFMFPLTFIVELSLQDTYYLEDLYFYPEDSSETQENCKKMGVAYYSFNVFSKLRQRPQWGAVNKEIFNRLVCRKNWPRCSKCSEPIWDTDGVCHHGNEDLPPTSCYDDTPELPSPKRQDNKIL